MMQNQNRNQALKRRKKLRESEKKNEQTHLKHNFKSKSISCTIEVRKLIYWNKTALLRGGRPMRGGCEVWQVLFGT